MVIKMNNVCVSLKKFKNYDYIINFSHYNHNLYVQKNIEMYQDYIMNYAYLNSDSTNQLLDQIMYEYIKNKDFQNFVENYPKEDFFIGFKNCFIHLYKIYQELSKKSKKETRWL